MRVYCHEVKPNTKFVAERINPLPTVVQGTHRRIYPWEEWTDGNAWRIRRGEDYEVPSESMAQMVRNYGRTNGIPVRARENRELDAVEFQFSPVEERAA